MALTIELAPDQERALEARAARNGQTLSEFLHHLAACEAEAEKQAIAAARRDAVREGYGKFAHLGETPDERRRAKDEELRREAAL